MSEYTIRCTGGSYQIWRGQELKSNCDSYSEAQEEIKEIQLQDEIDEMTANITFNDLPF